MVKLQYLLPLATLTYIAAADVLSLTSKTFDKIVYNSNKPAFVEFFAPWCGHCKQLAPTFEELATSFKASGDKVTIANLDGDKHKDIAKRFGVQGFPTMKYFDGTPDAEPIDYNGGRDLESLSAFISEKANVKVKGPKKAPSHVQMLTESSFKTEVGGDKDVFVAFTAPWCGHCKTLAPTWEKLAVDFASEPSVLIAKVDAEADNSKALAQEQEVTGFPTMKFFPKGSKTAETYQGGRSEDALVEFVNSKAGTYRTVGGKLNTKAGTVELIDTILAKYVTGKGLSELDKVGEEVKAAAADLKDTTVAYYLRALAKITGNPEYAMKEQSRLAGILKKGGLAPEKIDDLQRRSNILAKFLVKDGKSGDIKDEL